MKIEINNIPKQGLDLIETWQAEEHDLQMPQVHFAEPIEVCVRVRKDCNSVNLGISARTKVQLVCTRCLLEYISDFSKDFRLDYTFVKENEILDPTDQIREELILLHPIKALCSYECRGLCLVCGQNLNIAKCSCVKKEFAKETL